MIYADIVRGKLDQRNQQLEVDYAVGRDIRPEQVGDIVKVLEEWYSLHFFIFLKTVTIFKNILYFLHFSLFLYFNSAVSC